MIETVNCSHYLLPGSLFVHQKAYIVTTVLGSCVSVCLWDSVKNIGGINHYMLPLWNGEGLASPRYGNFAIAKLIERMLKLGSDKRNLRAKIFGGGEMFKMTTTLMNIGERNVTLAQDVLSEEKIPIIASDVGGKIGRKIIYHTATGTISVKRLAHQIDDIRI